MKPPKNLELMQAVMRDRQAKKNAAAGIVVRLPKPRQPRCQYYPPVPDGEIYRTADTLIAAQYTLHEAKELLSKAYVHVALGKSRGIQAGAALKIGVHRNTISRIITNLGGLEIDP